MSPVNIHDVFVPIYVRAPQSSSHILTKGAAFTESKNIPESEVLNWRLAPDMNPLSFQLQDICSIAQNLIIIVLGSPMPEATVRANASSATTFAGLQARIANTIELLQQTTRAQFEGKDQTDVEVRALGTEMTGLEYVQEFGVPNFYFHNSMVYALFTAHGAPIGKWDYLKGGT